MKKIIDIEGMFCASCALKVRKNLAKTEGVSAASVNFSTGRAEVKFDNRKISVSDLEKIVKKSGYKIAEKRENKILKKAKEEKRLKAKVIWSIIFTLPIFLRMVWHWEIPGELFGVSSTNWVQHDLAFIVVFFCGWLFHKNTYLAIKRGEANMDTLISVGTLSAYFYSLWAMFNGGHIYFESAATITSLILLGKFLELKSKNRASRAMEKLMELGATKAVIINPNGSTKEVGIEEVKLGNVLLVKAGEKIPLDAKIVKGKSNLDESMLTGESLPVFKEEKEEVYGATLNLDSVLHIKVSKKPEETMLAQIIKTVEKAQQYKAPVQRLADKIAGIFVPVVIGLAILTFLGWWFVGGNIGISIINAVAVLIISCPCALGIATPIAIMVGTSVGAKNGILIKNGESFEKGKHLDMIVFDKTGTLTEGKPRVRNIIINKENKFAEESIIKFSASLAKNSNHPLSQAILRYSQDKKITTVQINNFKEIIGRGVSGIYAEHKTSIFLGNIKLLKEQNIDYAWAKEVAVSKESEGASLLYVVYNDKIMGAIVMADKIKADAKEAIGKLKSLGFSTMLLSGDNKYSTAGVAKQLGMDKFIAEVLPHEKQKYIKNWQKAGKRVVFAGDGINDAPALAQANLGIAMGSGSDIAKESGDFIIIKNNPLKIYEAINLSRKTFTVIKQNLFWAFAYNVLAIPLAMAGLVNPMFGALAMGISDLTVVSNTLRIYSRKRY